MKNPNCDGSHCQSSVGQVRVLPYSRDGNLILCLHCYAYEIAWRRDRNKSLAKDCQFDLPKWEELAVYTSK